EKAYMKMQKGEKPMLPVWLSPTQVRIIPVAERNLQDAIRLMEELEKNKIRVDVDDRGESVDKKIRDGESEWIPYIIVYGDKEKERGILPVRVREQGKIIEMTLEELIEHVKERIKDKPFKPLTLPKLLSRRPSFK
ncbi:MAG: His/Gly/Thr/Pro-type tRNA ligase C-terminal domain-containing protein, partial [Nitrososphaerota archaeon]